MNLEHEFYFDNWDFAKDNVFEYKNSNLGAAYPPSGGNFLLSDGTNFLLSDNTLFELG